MSTEDLPPLPPASSPPPERALAPPSPGAVGEKPPGEQPAARPGASEPRPGEAPERADRPTQDGLQRAGSRLPGFLRRKYWLIAGLVLVIGLSILVWLAISARTKPQSALGAASEAVPVPVVRVTRQDLYNEVTIPAEFRPYVEVELHAKVSGYVQVMNVDFGDRVKANQLLATLEVPELQDDLNQAVAMQKRAEADHTDAHLIYARLVQVNKAHPNLVAQQDLDNAEAKDLSTAAAIAEAKALAGKYRTLQTYTQITAPFDGVITWRYVDPGALMQAGTSGGQAMPLLRVSDNYHLRLDIPVSLRYVKDMRVGDPVDVRVESLGTKSFIGTITRTTLMVSVATRTMITEIEVLNPNLEIVPGMYARVTLKVQERPHALCIPTVAVSAQRAEAKAKERSTVYVVNGNDTIEERTVTLGLEMPNRYEVTAGLSEGELVMTGVRTKVQPGQKVTPAITPPLTYD